MKLKNKIYSPKMSSAKLSFFILMLAAQLHSNAQENVINQTIPSIKSSIAFINTYAKAIEDSGYQILHLNISNFPFHLGVLKIDDYLSSMIDEYGDRSDKIFVKVFALFKRDNLHSGKLILKLQNKANPADEKDKKFLQTDKYKKEQLPSGQTMYSWELEFTPKYLDFKREYYHEIQFDIEPFDFEIRTAPGVKDVGIAAPNALKPKINIVKRDDDQLILIVYRK
jgi:hypothetical protein